MLLSGSIGAIYWRFEAKLELRAYRASFPNEESGHDSQLAGLITACCGGTSEFRRYEPRLLPLVRSHPIPSGSLLVAGRLPLRDQVRLLPRPGVIVKPVGVKVAYDFFVVSHCEKVKEQPGRIYTPNGSSRACIYLAGEALVRPLGRPAVLVMVGHPSKYSRRADWSLVTKAVGYTFANLGLNPLPASFVTSLADLPGYGQTV